jgi:hypothetical protein
VTFLQIAPMARHNIYFPTALVDRIVGVAGEFWRMRNRALEILEQLLLGNISSGVRGCFTSEHFNRAATPESFGFENFALAM